MASSPIRTLAILATGLATSAIVGYCDIITGELRLTTFYLAIIFGTTWLLNRTLGFLMALVDLAWGTLVTALTAAGAYALGRAFGAT